MIFEVIDPVTGRVYKARNLLNDDELAKKNRERLNHDKKYPVDHKLDKSIKFRNYKTKI